MEETASRYVLTVRADGPRWLGPEWWQSLGLDADALNQDSVALYHTGTKVPVPLLWVDSPDGAGALFYGATVSSTVGAAGTYVLALGEQSEPAVLARVLFRDRPGCQTTTLSTLSLEEDLVYRSTAPLDSPWPWQSLRPPERLEVAVSLPNLQSGERVSLTVRMWGQSAMPQDPDHHLRVSWNGEVVEDHTWDGSALETWSVSLPGTGSADNTLVLEAPGGTEAPVDVSWVDSVGLTWRRAMVLDADGWAMWRAESDGVACWQAERDITDPVVLLIDPDGIVSWGEMAGGISSEDLRVSQRAGDVGWIGVPWMAPAPDSVRPEEALADGALEGASTVVIAPAVFHKAIDDLLVARRAEGHDIRLVTTNSVYDTFGRGLPEALAIQAMVRELAAGGSMRYLLLVGDASPDPGSVWESGSTMVPTGWARTAHVGQTASDYALATGGTDEALVAVGRFPCEHRR